MNKPYPVGTKVIYNPPYTLCIGDEKYRNKVGIVVVNSFIHPQCRFLDGKQVSTAWESLIKVKIKNLQLEFAFMENTDA